MTPWRFPSLILNPSQYWVGIAVGFGHWLCGPNSSLGYSAPSDPLVSLETWVGIRGVGSDPTYQRSVCPYWSWWVSCSAPWGASRLYTGPSSLFSAPTSKAWGHVWISDASKMNVGLGPLTQNVTATNPSVKQWSETWCSDWVKFNFHQLRQLAKEKRFVSQHHWGVNPCFHHSSLRLLHLMDGWSRHCSPRLQVRLWVGVKKWEQHRCEPHFTGS